MTFGRFTHVFRALRHRSFRIYWVGQWVSVTGTWMQTLAQSWLIYRLTNSPLSLGFLTIARFGPSLIGSPVAGVLSDRLPRRSVVLATQAMSLIVATALALLTFTGAIKVWQVLTLALIQGCVDTLDMPARHTLQVDLVGIEDLQSAVSLNSSAFNTGRMIGPALAGFVVATSGEGACFAINAVSYLAVLIALFTIKPVSTTFAERHSIKEELLEGVRFAWNHRTIRVILFGIAITSGIGLSYTTLLPVFAGDELHGGVKGYGILLASVGVGAVCGALAAGLRTRQEVAPRINVLGQFALGVGLVALSIIHNLVIASIWLVFVGMAVAVQLSTTNGFLQTSTPADLRGRVFSIYLWIFSGLSPLGGLLAGWMAHHVGVRWTAAVAGGFCSLTALVLWMRLLAVSGPTNEPSLESQGGG